MAEFSNFLSKELLDHAFGEQARDWDTNSTTLYLAITVDGGTTQADTGVSIVEPTAGYTRAAISFSTAVGTTTATTSNSATITITNTGGTTWNAQGIAIVDNATKSLGNMYCFDTGMTDASVGPGEKLQFTIGDIDVTLG